jgi:hypothetical protein
MAAQWSLFTATGAFFVTRWPKDSSGAPFYAKTIELDLRALLAATKFVLTEKLAPNLK